MRIPIHLDALTRIRGILHRSIGEASPGFFERRDSNLATDYDEQIRVPHVLKNMGHPASDCIEMKAGILRA